MCRCMCVCHCEHYVYSLKCIITRFDIKIDTHTHTPAADTIPVGLETELTLRAMGPPVCVEVRYTHY